MGTITITVPSAGSPRTAASVANPLNVIKNEINGNLDNNNIKEGANIGWSKLAKSGSAFSDLGDTVVTGVATGDILYRDSAGKWVNLAIGATAKILKVVSGIPSWSSTQLKIDSSYGDIAAATDGATVTFDLALSNVQQVTLGGNRTLALSNVTTGQKFVLRLVQDGTGSRLVTWFTTIKWAGGAAPTLTTTAGKADLIGFICTGTGTYDGFIIGQNI